MTQQWKDEAVARSAMAKVLLNAAKEAPAAFLPHLEPLVGRVQQLWDQVRVWLCVCVWCGGSRRVFTSPGKRCGARALAGGRQMRLF